MSLIDYEIYISYRIDKNISSKCPSEGLELMDNILALQSMYEWLCALLSSK